MPTPCGLRQRRRAPLCRRITGFSIPEIDSLIEGLAPEESGDPDAEVLSDEGPPICRVGDIWAPGPHRLICGSALNDVVSALMNRERAQMAFTDPPYNVPIQGRVGGSDAIRHREFVMASGEMTKGEFTAFQRESLSNLAAHTTDGSIHFVCMDWGHMAEVLEAAEDVYSTLKNLIVE